VKLYSARLVASVRWSGVLANYRTFVNNVYYRNAKSMLLQTLYE